MYNVSLYNVIMFLFLGRRRMNGISKWWKYSTYCATSTSQTYSPSIVQELSGLCHYKLGINLLPHCRTLILLHYCQQNLISLFTSEHIQYEIWVQGVFDLLYRLFISPVALNTFQNDTTRIFLKWVLRKPL